MLTVAHILYFETRISPRGVSGRSECSITISDANFLIVFHSNYGSILLSFRAMTVGQTADGRQTDVGNRRMSLMRPLSATVYLHYNAFEMEDAVLWVMS